ncbi:MAG: ABC-ATPase UvrA [Blastopirellula sp.]|nr:ABC-ATPase UvrA [Blastopirellula sp.]
MLSAASEPREGLDDVIQIRGARVHNLQNLDVDIPHDRLVVITGPSGSGKSSLAFDTLYAEGQRQYMESLSAYARQFLNQMERPDVDLIEGLQPTLCIDQRPANVNPRSTVATVTEIYDYLRLLMARLGEVVCYQCGRPIEQQTVEQIQERLLELPEGTKAMILAPLVRGRRGQHQDVLAAIRKAGYVRVRIDDRVYDLDQVPELEPRKSHSIEAVVDRVVIREGSRARIAESIDAALHHADGLVIVCYLDEEDEWREELFSTLYACVHCNLSYEEIEPRTFSFNSPYGACPECDGLGKLEQFDVELVLPSREHSLAAGAVQPWQGLTKAALGKIQRELEPFLEARGSAWDTPLVELTDQVVEQLLWGDGKKFAGILMMLEKEYATTTKAARLELLERYRAQTPCNACGGARLCQVACSVRVSDANIHDLVRMTMSEAREFFESLEFHEDDAPIADPLLSELVNRLRFLEKVGVGYLTLDRSAETLSGGELQRVRLATSIGSGLVGVCYVLDEPSIGLHPRDNERLIKALRDLQDQGNTVVVVEHDEGMMRAADWLIDVGPGAGSRGGRIVAHGTPQDVARDTQSVTGRYLGGQDSIPVPQQRRKVAKKRSLSLEGAVINNLRDLDVDFPLGTFTCVTGVSGSGKSSLVNETLAPSLLSRLNGSRGKTGPHRSLRGVNQIDKVISIDQSPIGRSPRSNAATYTGAFDEIRKVYARTKDAKQRGYKASRFSFNVKGGRCETCQGHGLQKIEMNFLPDLYIPCDACAGARFNPQTLEVQYKGKSISDVLEMPVDEAVEFFENVPVVDRLMESLRDVGLGYLPLGQPSTTISGGEGQRIKLATELARVDTGNTLYLLDEPTTGLHFDDIKRLLAVLNRLVDKGNTVIVIEHNLDVIKCADWIIDLGPEGGAAGGALVGAGKPEEIAELPDSYTGAALRSLLQDA